MSSSYIIQHKGLSLGRHNFTFNIGDNFFADYPEGEVSEGNLCVNIELIKHSTMLELSISIGGIVGITCDRCLEPMELPIEYGGKLLVKVQQEQGDANDEVWSVSENDHELNLTHHLYESICLSLPIQRVHGRDGAKPDACDATMLRYIIQSGQAGEQDGANAIDPRWEKLRDKKY